EELPDMGGGRLDYERLGDLEGHVSGPCGCAQVAGWFGEETLAAAGVAEVVGVALVLGAMPRPGDDDGHPADGIERRDFGGGRFRLRGLRRRPAQLHDLGEDAERHLLGNARSDVEA